MTHLILISGSMAAGKSTIAEIVVERLRESGLAVVSASLDLVADMARPTLPDWDWAHDIHARLVGLWVDTGIDVVVDEGASSVAEVEALLAHAGGAASVFHVVVHTDYPQALRRAQADPTRGISKDPDFLLDQYRHFAEELPSLPQDLVLEVRDETPDTLAARLLEAWSATIGAAGDRLEA